MQPLRRMLLALRELLHLLCGLPLANAWSKDIVLCGRYRTFASIPGKCPSLTTRVRESKARLLLELTCSDCRERRKGAKTEN